MPITKNDPILIVGAGSIGERHIGNLQKLGYHNILVFRSRNLPLRNISAETIRIFTDWNEVLNQKPKLAFVSSPTSLHLTQAIQCAEAGMHLFIEKPIAHQTEGKEKLLQLIQEKNLFAFVGYMMHYHPLAKKLKKFIGNQEFGPLVSFSSHWGEYLPNWHPWEDYREGYAARKDLGGGAALTLSHDLDLIFWLTGKKRKRYFYLPNHKSSLEVTAEAGADFLIELEDGCTGHVHLNYFQQPSERHTELIFEDATVKFEYYYNRLEIRNKSLQPNQPGDFISCEGFDRNQMFVDQLEDFFQQLAQSDTANTLQQLEHAFDLVEMCQSA